MHSYVIESSERRDVPFFLAAASIAATLAAKGAIQRAGFEPDALAYIPSGFAVYGVLFVLFDRWLWRMGLLRALGVVRVPPLNGTWIGELRSSHSDLQKAHSTTLRIDQRWTSIRLTLESDRSFSASEMALVKAISSTQLEIRWEYLAESKNPSAKGGFNHRGVTFLRLSLVGGSISPEMTGHYYTQHGRSTHGTITVKREE